jgi:purine-cytosine permease-like protein
MSNLDFLSILSVAVPVYLTMAVGAVIICVLTFIAAIFGHATIVATETFVSYSIAAALVVIALVLAPHFNPARTASALSLGSFWPTWFLSAAICAAVPISYAPLANDYSRYLPEHSSIWKVSLAAGGGMFIGCLIALTFAAYVSTLIIQPGGTFVTGMISILPAWLVALSMLIGLIGSQPQGSLCLYGCGLSLEATHPSLKRVPATIVSSLTGLGIVLVGIFGLKMEDMILAFLTLVNCAATPWMAILLIGHFVLLKGNYHPVDLFAFERPGGGGRYWYRSGLNVPAVLAWLGGAIAGLLFVSTSIFTGPLASLLNGISLEWLISGSVGGLLYLIFTWVSQGHEGARS